MPLQSVPGSPPTVLWRPDEADEVPYSWGAAGPWAAMAATRDGQEVAALASPADKPQSVWLRSIRGDKDPVCILETDEVATLVDLSFSPSGDRLALMAVPDGLMSESRLDAEVYILLRAEGWSRVGDPIACRTGEFDWGADDETLLLVGRDERLTKVDLKGVAGKRLCEEGAAPCTSPDGRRVAYVDRRDDTLHVLTDARDKVIGRTSDSSYLAWLPDGEELIVAERDGQWSTALFRCDMDGRVQELGQCVGIRGLHCPIAAPDWPPANG